MRWSQRGAVNPRSKLTEAQREEVARAVRAGARLVDLARRYRVSNSLIGRVAQERRPTRRLPWPPTFPGIETPEFLLTVRGSFPPDEVLARARAAMLKDLPPALREKDES